VVLAPLKVVTSADVLSAFYRQNIHSFIFVPVFRLGRVPGAAAPRRLELFHRQQRSQIVLRLSWLHAKTGQSNVGDATNPTGPSTSGPLSRGYSQQDLHRKSFVTFLVKMAEPMQLGLLDSEEAFRDLQISQLRSLSRSVTS